MPIPVLIDGRRARVLVVGGGECAARQAEAAAESGAAVRVVGGAPGSDLRAAAARQGAIVLEQRAYAPDDVAWATLVFALDDDEALNARVAEHAQAAGRLVAVPGAAALGSCSAPATLRHGDVLIAVSAGELAPLARVVLARIGERVGPAYAEALSGLEALHDALVARGDGERWNDAVEALLDDDAWQAIERGTFARRLSAWR